MKNRVEMSGMNWLLLLLPFLGFPGAEGNSGARDVARESDMLNKTRKIENDLLKLQKELKAHDEGAAKDMARMHSKLGSVLQMLEKMKKPAPGVQTASHLFQRSAFIFFLSYNTHVHAASTNKESSEKINSYKK